MSDNKPKLKRLLSPLATAVYPKLHTPDSYTPAGSTSPTTPKFKLKFRIPEANCKQLVAELDAEVEAAVIAANEARALKPKRDKKTGKPVDFTAEAPYAVEMDKEGNASGYIIFSAGTKAHNKDGSVKRVPLFDAKGAPLPLGVEVWGGSKVKVNFSPAAYANDGSDKAGVTLYLNAVQVLELVTKGQGTADQFGFGVEADGFDGSTVDQPEAMAADAGSDVPSSASKF